MADGSAPRFLELQGRREPRLQDSLGQDHHLLARCAAPRCRRAAPCDPRGWVAQGLGQMPLAALTERLRCVCGARRAELEIRPGAFAPVERPDLYIFR